MSLRPSRETNGQTGIFSVLAQLHVRIESNRQRSGNRNAKFHHLTRIQLGIEASLIGKFHSFLRRCDNKKNQGWPTAAMFFDRLDFGFGS